MQNWRVVRACELTHPGDASGVGGSARLRWSAALLALICLLVSTPPARAQEPLWREPREEDLRLFEVVLEQHRLSETLVGYDSATSGTLLPLGALAEVIGIAITTAPEEGLADGFIIREDRRFHLDVPRREVTIDGVVSTFDPARVEIYRDDIYVDSTLLSEWLPVKLDVDLFGLRINVRPREPLPLQQRLAREAAMRRSRALILPEDPGYPEAEIPYRFWSGPFIDQTLRLTLGDENAASFSTFGTGDLFYMESEWYLAGTQEDPLDDFRITLRRRDPEGELLGFLNAREVAVGHVMHPATSLLSQSHRPAPGFLVTNHPITRPTEFDRHSFRGNLPPGWDVELYHNGLLIEYQQAGPGGQYFFDDVPLLFGMNFFRLVFYGPQGQRREEHYRFLLGQTLTAPGEFQYRVTGSEDEDRERRGLAQLSLGLHRHLTAAAELASLPVAEQQETYGKLGLRSFWSSAFFYGDIVSMESGETALDLGLQSRVFGVNVSASRTTLSEGFVSELFMPAADPIRTRDQLRLDASIPGGILPRIPVMFAVQHDETYGGHSRTRLENRISTRYRRLAVTNRLTWNIEDDADSPLEGSLQLSRWFRRWGIRGELLYALSPGTATALNLTFERGLFSGYRFVASVNRSLISDRHSYTAGIYKTLGSFGGGLAASYLPSGDFVTHIDISAGVTLDPRRGDLETSARARAGQGALSGRVFLDRNLNGVFDEGDEPIENVHFTVNGSPRGAPTGDDGTTLITELSPHQPLNLAIDTRTLEDPLWIPDPTGVRVVPRPGTAMIIDFPVLMTGEVDGTVYAERNGRLQPAAGLTVELIDESGDVAYTEKSAYDGFYLFTGVRPGTYEVRISPAAVDRAPGAVAASKRVQVTAEGSVVSGADLALRSSEPEVRVAEAAPPPEQTEPAPATPTTPRPVETTASAPAAAGQSQLQVGAFRIRDNAVALRNRVIAIAPAVRVVEENGRYYVRSAPGDPQQIAQLRTALRNAGFDTMILGAPAQVGTPETRQARTAPARSDYTIQIGAFAMESNAQETAAKARRLTPHVSIAQRGQLYVVEAGPFDEQTARIEREKLTGAGFDALLRRSSGTRPAPGFAVAAPPPSSARAPSARHTPARSSSSAAGAQYVVQIGAFRVRSHADDAARRARTILPAAVDVVQRGELWIVEAGPYSPRSEMISARDRLKAAGFDVFARRLQKPASSARAISARVPVMTPPSRPTTITHEAPVTTPASQGIVKTTPEVTRAEPGRKPPTPAVVERKSPQPAAAVTTNERTAGKPSDSPMRRPPATARADSLETPTTAQQVRYAIQLSITNNAGDAEAMRKRAAMLVSNAYVENSGGLLVVRVGPFDTREAAEAARERLRRQELSGVIIPLRQRHD